MLQRILVIGALIMIGCRSTAKDVPPPITKSPARLELDDFGTHFSVAVERSASRIAEQHADPEIRRNTIYWRMRSIPACRAALTRADDQAAYLDLWLLCARMKQYFAAPAGAELLSTGSADALEAATKLEKSILAIHDSFLDEEQFKDASARIDEYINAQPFDSEMAIAPESKSAWSNTMSNVLHKPLKVVSATWDAITPNTGISATADAINRASLTVDQAAKELGYLPDQVRWNTDLLMLELQQAESVQSAVLSFGKLGDSATSLAATAAALPADVRKELSGLLDEIDQKGGLQTTVTEARGAIQDADGALERVESIAKTADEGLDKVDGIVTSANGVVQDADGLMQTTDKTAGSLTTMSSAVEAAFDALTRTMVEINRPSPPPRPGKTPGPPFDINDYGRTAEKLTETANALAAVLGEVQNLTQPEQGKALVKTTDTAVRSAADYVLWRASFFALLVFVLALAYKFLGTKLARRASA